MAHSPSDDFHPGMNSSQYLSGHFLVAVTQIHPRMTSSWDDFIPVLNTRIKCHPGMKNGEDCRVNGLLGMKAPCMNSVCEGMGEFNSGRTIFVSGSQDENTHVKQKFYHPGKKLLSALM